MKCPFRKEVKYYNYAGTGVPIMSADAKVSKEDFLECIWEECIAYLSDNKCKIIEGKYETKSN